MLTEAKAAQSHSCFFFNARGRTLEAISKMSEQHEEASELYESEEVFDLVFPSGDQSAVVLHPGKDAFDFPAAAIATQRASVLRLALAVGSVGRDHLDPIFLGQRQIQRIRIVGLVADQFFGQLIEEASGQNSFHKFALGRRSAFDSNGERKTITRGDSDDLGALAPLSTTVVDK